MGATIRRASQEAMGGMAEMRIESADERAAEAAFALFFDSIEASEQDLSHFRPKSEISRINRLAAKAAVVTDARIFELLAFCVDLSRRSAGAFDVTLGPLSRAYAATAGDGALPDAEALRSARSSTGWRHLELDRATRSVRFRKPGLELDLGAVGKGWALDRAGEELVALGIGRALLGLSGSSWLVLGAPSDRPGWPFEIETPFGRRRTISRIEMAGRSLSTSGAGTPEPGGPRRSARILDPTAGAPVGRPVQVSVIAASATRSDALATTLAVAGRSAGALLGAGESALLLREGASGRTEIDSLHWPLSAVAPG